MSTKWQNIRDAFVRSLRKKSGQAATVKYIFHDNLQFLLKVVTKDATESSLRESQPNDVGDSTQQDMPREQDISDSVSQHKSPAGLPPLKRSKKIGDVDKEILRALTERDMPDEDDGFFMSIKPSVQSLSEDDKFEFRIGVMQLLQNIKKRDKYTCRSVDNHSPLISQAHNPSPGSYENDSSDGPYTPRSTHSTFNAYNVPITSTPARMNNPGLLESPECSSQFSFPASLILQTPTDHIQ